MEMLIVVAIIAVLVAIAIPVYTSQMHKARVAADKANLRAYYAQIQADYMLTEKQNPNVKVMDSSTVRPDYTTIIFLDGATVKLQAVFIHTFADGRARRAPDYPSCGRTYLKYSRPPPRTSYRLRHGA